MTDFLVQKFVKQERKKKELKKLYIGFSSIIEIPQLGSAWLSNFTAWFSPAWVIPAQTHHYCVRN